MAIGSHEGQKTHGTFKEQFTFLYDILTKSVEEGAATPEEYMGTLLQLLKAVEAIRLKNEAALLELKKQESYHTAAVNVCSMMGSLVLNIVNARTNERHRILEGAKIIEHRALAEDKERLGVLRNEGKKEEADALEKDIARREAEFRGDEVLSIGGEKEVEITKKAVLETREILGGILGKPPLNPHTYESRTMQEVVADSLQAVPVQEIPVVRHAERAKKKKKKLAKNKVSGA